MRPTARLLLAAAAVAAVTAAPAPAQTVEELTSELEAQKQINQLLKDRIEALENQLSGRPPPLLPASAAESRVAEDGPSQDRALERALQRRGAAVLGAGVVEVAPTLSWTHSGRDLIGTADDRLGASVDARLGLPGGWMIGAAVPLAYRRLDGVGSNSGLGDASLSVWKSIARESGARPAIVGGLRYSAPTAGDPAEDEVPIGSGFHRLSARVTALKTVDPAAFFGELSYTAHVAEAISGFDVDRGPVYGIGAGASLAVTPDVSASVGLDFAFEREARIDGVGVGGRSTLGAIEIGLGAVLSRNLFLNVAGSFGITDDSPDLTVSASLPFRF